MKKSLISLALLALCANAHAQFTFRKADGKTISVQKAPDCKWKLIVYPTELYFNWEKDRVRVYEVQYDRDGTVVDEVKEYYIYYVNFDPKKSAGYYSDSHKSFLYSITLKDNKRVPFHLYWKRQSSGEMKDSINMYFPSQKEADSFIAKVLDKGLEMSLDLDYEAPPQLVFEKYESSETEKPSPSPAPAKRTDARITLANDSGAEIRLSYQASPTANSARTITIGPKSTFFLKGAIGGQVYWMKLKSGGLYAKDKLAIDIVESMDDTKIIVAK